MCVVRLIAGGLLSHLHAGRQGGEDSRVHIHTFRNHHFLIIIIALIFIHVLVITLHLCLSLDLYADSQRFKAIAMLRSLHACNKVS